MKVITRNTQESEYIIGQIIIDEFIYSILRYPQILLQLALRSFEGDNMINISVNLCTIQQSKLYRILESNSAKQRVDKEKDLFQF